MKYLSGLSGLGGRLVDRGRERCGGGGSEGERGLMKAWWGRVRHGYGIEVGSVPVFFGDRRTWLGTIDAVVGNEAYIGGIADSRQMG